MIKELSSGFSEPITSEHFREILANMEISGFALGVKRNMYHSIIALQNGETLDARQIKRAVDTLALNLGLKDHQRVVIEHRKAGRQHFHIVFNILQAETGKQAKLKWTRKVEWNTSRQLERMFNLKPVISKGHPARQWECERGKRSGVDPIKMRKEVTAIYKRAKTASEFIDLLAKAGFTLCLGKNSSFVLVDKAGDVHGLMRRIEGVKLKDFKLKFGDFADMRLASATVLQKQRKPIGKNAKALPKSFVFKPLTLPRISAGSASKPIRALRLGAASIGRIISPITDARKMRDELRGLLQQAATLISRHKKRDENKPSIRVPSREEIERSELLAYAWDNGRLDILRQYGFTFPEPDDFQ